MACNIDLVRALPLCLIVIFSQYISFARITCSGSVIEVVAHIYSSNNIFIISLIN